jgi:predicted ATPase/class 3 adenylate cyclase
MPGLLCGVEGTPEFPTGTVTFLFTDLVGSTRQWEEHPAEMHGALARHDELLRAAIEGHGGSIVKMTGDGAHAAFATAPTAVGAAVDAQIALTRERWGSTGPLCVRMGVHSGHAEQRSGDYFGPTLNRAARLMSVAHGGQIVVSGVVEDMTRGALPPEVSLADLGMHRLRDLGFPERVFQVLHPDLPRDFAPLASVESYPTNLPLQVTTFVGRDAEIAEVAAALSEMRVVTLTGVGGVGKTRLAVQIAAEFLPEFGNGVWLCELGPVSDASGVADVVATTLSVQLRPGGDVTESIVAAVRDRSVLLVLDNCEHLIVPAARLVDAIVRACPGVRILATSREGLGVAGERLMLVRSLAVPDEDASPDALVGCDAARLFVDRATAARRGFAVTADNAPAIAQICRRLDGIPLAIELAAARTRMLSPSEIARRLDERFRLLTGGTRTAVERHQTLRAAVDWSYALLTSEEQVLLDRLGVFSGGFTFDAAEAVAGELESGSDVLDLLGQLVDKSLVVADEQADGSTRYRLLETIRQYALEQLDATGASDEVRRRHAEHYITVAQATEGALWTRDEDEWLRIVDQELGNFRAALDWAIGVGDADVALRLAVPLGEVGAPRPRYTIARWLVRAVAMPAAFDHPLRPHVAAWAAQGAFSISTSVAELSQGVAEMDAAFERAGLEPIPIAHAAHAALAVITGAEDEAIRHSTAAVELALATGDRRWAATWAGLLAGMLALRGRPEEAIQRAEQSRALASESGTLCVPAETALGFALSQVDPEAAIPQLEAAWTLSMSEGNEVMLSVSGTCLGSLLVARGDVGSGLEYYDQLLANALETRNPVLALLTCNGLGVMLAGADHPEAAATIFGALESQAFRPLTGIRQRQQLDALETLRGTMTADAFAQSYSRGQTMTLEELLEFAREEASRMTTATTS